MIEHRRCFRDPIPEIYESAELLNKALIFHLKNETRKTKELLLKADMPMIRDWTESIWGAKSPYIKIMGHHQKIETWLVQLKYLDPDQQ